MSSWGQAKFTEDSVGMLFPKSRGFGMALHRGEDWDHVARWNRGLVHVIFPPFVESMVGADEEALLGWGGFIKRVADIRPQNEQVFGRQDSIEKS